MKKVLILTTVLVLTISLLTGCGCTRQDAGMDNRPSTEMTILPTNIPETTAPLLPETEPATTPMTDAPSENPTDETMGNGSNGTNGSDSNNGSGGNGGEGSTGGSEAATEGARSRMK